MAGSHESNEGLPEIAVYIVESYYCEKMPLGQCDRVADGSARTDGGTIEVVLGNPDFEANEFYQAFAQAKEGAPICDIHGTDMLPKIFKSPST